jgi:hypothetical protein
MTNIHIVIPVADPSVQDFSSLVNNLCGNYIPEDHITTTLDENGEEVEEVVENPYKNSPAPDYSNKIILVSHSPINAPEGSENVVIDGELNVAKLWNAGLAHAIANDATHAVVLNEVSSINPHVFDEAVSENTEPVINLSDGGCFILTPGIQANESYRWWFADVELFENNETAVSRKEFLDIVQENAVPIEGAMSDIVNADMATRGV